jgi:hypothetical protein
MKVDHCGLTLGQREGGRSGRLFEPPQVQPGGPEISAAEYPATLLERAPAFSSPAHLYHFVKPYPRSGDEKVGKKPLGVLLTICFCFSAEENRDTNPHSFLALRVPVTASGIAVNY